MPSARRFFSPRPLLAILLPGLLLASTAGLAYENTQRGSEAQAVEAPGVALTPSTPTPVPTSYSIAIPAEFEQYRLPIETLAASLPMPLEVTTSASDITFGWETASDQPDLAFAEEEIALTVPMAAPVFDVSLDDLRRVVAGEVSNWSEVGGGDGPIELVLAAGPAAAAHGLPTDGGGEITASAAALQLFSGMSTERRALRIDGKSPGSADYPLVVFRVVTAELDTPPELPTAVVGALRSLPDTEPSVTIAAVGDLMLANIVAINMASQGVDQPFELVAPYLQQADITFGNLEGTFTERGIAQPKNYTFRTPPSLAGGLVSAGFDLISVANNHTMDFGRDGLEDTLRTLDELGLPRVGAGANEAEARRPVILEANGLRIGFLAYVNVGQEVRSNYVNELGAADGDSPGVAWARPDEVAADVAALKPQVDLVVVSMHIGIENSFEIRDWQLETAHAAIDNGAALVLGHHAHVLQRIETYGEGVIIFGLGNFVFDVANPGNKTKTVIAYFELTRDGVQGYDFVPAEIDVSENRPRPLLGARGVPLLTHLLGLTELAPDPLPPTPTVTPTPSPTAAP